jgi:serine/threonine-protein kinase
MMMGIKCPRCHSDNNPETAAFCADCGANMASAKDTGATKTLITPAQGLKKGGTVAGRYRILEELGRGGMGVVFKAEDTKLKRTVALKFIPPELTHIPDVKERFMREAQAAAALDHPNICTVYEFDEAEEKTFISMAYVEGRSLRNKLESGPLEPDEALRIALQVAQGLKTAHRKGVVHSDIKSANIMVTEDNRAKIMDFGLARMGGGTLLTQDGMTMGTIAYMSPEQARGEAVDHRTDIWSLGVVLYEMFGGQLPFQGDRDQAVVYSILNRKPKPLVELRPEIPGSLGQVVDKALEKNPEKRYQQMDEMLDDLKSISAGCVPEDIKARLRKEKLRVRKKAVLYAGGAVLTVAAATLALVLFTGRADVIDSIAVLPLENLTGEPEKEFFVEVATEELIGQLGRISGLQRVISRTSVMKYKKTEKTLSEIARELNVDAVVEGSVQQAGDNVRVQVRLIDALPEERNLWGQTYERAMSDVLVMYGEMARAIAEKAQVNLTDGELTRLAGVRQVDSESYDAYLKGKFHHYKANLNDLATAMLYYELAIEKDPEFALAYAGIAGVWLWRQQLGLASPDEAGPKIMAAIERALELDGTLAEAHQQLASMHVWGRFDWKAGEEAFLKSLAMNPHYVEAHAYYSHLLLILRRQKEATEHNELALKLDPLNPLIKSFYGLDLLTRRRYDDCISICREIIKKNPATILAPSVLYEALFQTGRYEEAFEFIKLDFSNHDRLKDIEHVFDQHERLGFAATLNLAADTLLSLSKSKFIPTDVLVDLYLMAGNKERALDCLEQAFERHNPWLPYISARPLFDGLADEPRFRELLRKMKLPSSAQE